MAKIILVGKSAVGKSTIEKILVENFKYEKSVSCTTRQKRDGEVDGVDYYFITNDKFNELKENGEFIEQATYRGWQYGTLKSEIKKSENMVFVLNPIGLKQFKKLDDEFISFYVECDDRERLIHQLIRGDDVDELVRRYYSDTVDFKGIQDNVDFVVSNDTNIFECVNEILFDILYYYNPISIEEFFETLDNAIDKINSLEDEEDPK